MAVVHRDDALTVGHDLDGPFQVRPPDDKARHRRQVLERDRVRVAVLIVGAAADDGDARRGEGQQRRRGAGLGPVMADFQHVHRTDQAPFQQQRLNRGLRVAGQQRAKRPALQQHHERAVIDVPIQQRRLGVALIGIQNTQVRFTAEPDDVSGPCLSEVRGRFGPRQRYEARIGRVVVVATWLEYRADRKALERWHQAGDMVLVRMGEHQHVQPPLPEGQLLAQPPHGEVRVRAAVDQCSPARRRDDEDRVALADVEHDQVQPAIGPGQKGQGS